MSKYTVKASHRFDARVDADMRRIADAVAASPHAAVFRALILLGGYGRGEGTPFIVNGEQLPFNDYDLVVVSAPLSPALRSAVKAHLRDLERRLSEAIGLPVDLCLYPADTLGSAEFSLLNYEMKHGHRVVWGDPAILNRMPEYRHDGIPLSEGTRLLLNRGKLLLDVRRALAGGAPLTPEDRIRWWKFLLKAWLAFGDCALLIHGDYNIRYTIKQERILRYRTADVPDPDTLVEGYLHAIALKEWGDFAPLEQRDLAAELERTRRYFLVFLEWYEQRRTGVGLADPGRYAAALLRRGRECGAVKALALNLALLKTRAVRNGAALMCVHPRARLYLALPRLLGDEDRSAELVSMLAAASGERTAVEDAFYRLRARLS